MFVYELKNTFKLKEKIPMFKHLNAEQELIIVQKVKLDGFSNPLQF